MAVITHRLRSNWIVLAITFFALGIRVYRLDFFALRGDESFTVQFSMLPEEELFEGIRSVEPNPPLYYYALRGWMSIAGQSEYSSRFFSVFFGVLCVPLIYALGRTLGDRAIGSTAALIVAVNPFQLFHSQDVRNYTLWPVLTLVEWLCLWRALHRWSSRAWAGYALFALLGLYTHYYHLFVVLAENAVVYSLLARRMWLPAAYSRDRRRLLLTWIAAQAVVVAGFVAWLSVGSTRALTGISSGASPSLLEVIGRTLAAFVAGESIPDDPTPWLVLPAAMLIGVGAAVSLRRPNGGARLMLISAIGPLLCVFVVSQVRPLYRPRYLNATAPAYYLLAAHGLAWLARQPRGRWIGASAATAWLAISGYAHANALFDPRFAKSPDLRARAAYFVSQQQPVDVIIQNYPDPSLGYYYHGSAPLLVVPSGYLDAARRTETEAVLRDLLARDRRIWFAPLTSAEWDYDGTVGRWLARRADRVWRGSIAGLDVVLYEAPSVFTANIRPLEVVLEPSFRLVGYRVSADRIRPGESLQLVLYWLTDSTPDMDYNVFTHVLDAAGALRAQQDNAPVGGTYPTSQWTAGEIIVDTYDLALPIDLSPGVYRIEVGLYDWRTGARVTTAQGQDRVLLPVIIQVEP